MVFVILIQVLVALVIFTLGFFVLQKYQMQIDSKTILGLSYPVGISIFTLLQALFYTFDYFNPGPLLFLASIYVVVNATKISINVILIKKFTAISLLFLILASLNFTKLSYDSIIMLSLANSFYKIQNGVDFLYPFLSSWGIASISHQILYLVSGAEFSFLSGETLFISSLYLLNSYSRLQSDDVVPIKIEIPILLIFATTPFLLFQTQYYHNSLQTMVLFLGYMTLNQFGKKSSEQTLILLSYICFIAAVLTRTENGIFGTLLLAFMWQKNLDSKVEQSNYERVLISLSTIIIACWYIFIFSVIGAGSDILTPTRIILVVLPLICFALFTWLTISDFVLIKKIERNLLTLLVQMLFFGLLILTVTNLGHFLVSFKSLAVNMFLTGMWGGGFWTLLILLIITTIKYVQGEAILDQDFKWHLLLCIGFLMLLLIFSFSRVPYRIGWGDSANRMLTHIYPFSIYLALKAARLIKL